MTRLGWLPALLGRVTLLPGVTVFHVNVSRWGKPAQPYIHVNKPLKSRLTLLPGLLNYSKQHMAVCSLSLHFHSSIIRQPL